MVSYANPSVCAIAHIERFRLAVSVGAVPKVVPLLRSRLVRPSAFVLRRRGLNSETVYARHLRQIRSDEEWSSRRAPARGVRAYTPSSGTRLLQARRDNL